MDLDNIPTKQTKTTCSSTSTYATGHKEDLASQDENPLNLSHLDSQKETTPKRLKENQSKVICDKTKLKKIDHNHLYRNNVKTLYQ